VDVAATASSVIVVYLLDLQVVIFYGPRSNAELLLHSGFVYDDNAHDKLAVRMGQSFHPCSSVSISCSGV